MRLIKIFGPSALAAVAAMAFVSATSASASPKTSTELCYIHWELNCLAGGVNLIHLVLTTGNIGKVLTTTLPILCLGYLVHARTGALGPQQTITSESQTFTGCGTGSTHNNCTVTVPKQPVFNLLKTGLDVGTLIAASGQVRLVCSNLGIDCLYDVAGMEFAVGGGHLTANNAEITELGGKFFCPDWLETDGLMESLEDAYVLG